MYRVMKNDKQAEIQQIQERYYQKKSLKLTETRFHQELYMKNKADIKGDLDNSEIYKVKEI